MHPSQIIIHTATHPGTQTGNADHARHGYFHGGRCHVASIVDGIGTRPEAIRAARLCAEVLVYSAGRDGGRAAIMNAHGLFADTGQEFPRPDMSATVIVIPDDETDTGHYAHVGDTAVYAYLRLAQHADDDPQQIPAELRKLTVDQTKGTLIRATGGTEQDAADADHIVLNTVARTGLFGVQVGDIPEGTVALVMLTDGIHRTIPQHGLLTLVHDYMTQAPSLGKTGLVDYLHELPGQLVKAAREQAADKNSIDNMTAQVVLIPHRWDA